MSVNTNRAVAQSPAGVCLSVVGGGGGWGAVVPCSGPGTMETKKNYKSKRKEGEVGQL